MSKADEMFNWIIGTILTSGNLFLLIMYAITKRCTAFKFIVSSIWLIFGICIISTMIIYTSNKRKSKGAKMDK